MKSLLVSLSTIFLFAPTSSFAIDKDHQPNSNQVSRLAWEVADAGETLSDRAAWYGQYNIANEANDVHMAASDLYHLANNNWAKSDEKDHRLEQAFENVETEFNQLSWYFSNDKDHQLEQYWYNLKYWYYDLCMEMHGPNKHHECDLN